MVIRQADQVFDRDLGIELLPDELRPSGSPDATLTDAWGDWLALAAGDGLAATEPGAIIVRRELPDGRVYGSTSVTLVALAADGRLRYDFQPDPQAGGDWYPVETA